MSKEIDYNRIKIVLAEKKKTNKWFVETLDYVEPTVSRSCTNDAQPSIEALAKTARALDVDICELLNKTKLLLTKLDEQLEG